MLAASQPRECSPLLAADAAPRDAAVPDEPLLAASGLRWTAGGRRVVDGVGVALRAGEALALLGPNGAGKTSVLRILAGAIRPDAGQVALCGTDVTALPLHRRARLGLGYLPQEPSVFTGLSVRENLDVALELAGGRRGSVTVAAPAPADRAAELLAVFELTALADQRASTVSGGERRRLELARLLAIEPAVVLLDEPFAGLDPLAALELRKQIARLTRGGVAVLLADHCVDHALAVCHRAVVLAGGRVIVSGPAEEVRADDLARRAFFGSTVAKPGE